jgi:HK97 gp10 family phage protein
MQFTVEVEGIDKLQGASEKLKKEITVELGKGLLAAAQKVERSAKDSIRSGSKTGRIYTRRTVSHRASAPGEAPASNTGRLINSISSYVNRLSGVTEGLVVAGRGVVKYARMLEFGTAKMAARPFMVPAFERNKRWIEERLARAVNYAIMKVAKK